MSLRVLVTADAVGGVWQYATDLAHALAPIGVEAIVALLGPAPSADQRRMAQGLTLIETGLALDWLCDGPAAVIAAGDAIAALAAREGVDLVHLNMPTLAAQATFAAPTIAVTHGCVATWWEAAHDTPLAADYHWHRAMTGKGLRAVDRVVAPSAAYAATVARHYRLSPDPHVIRNGRRPFAVATRAPHDQVFTAGRLWDRVKGTDILEAAAARIGIPFLAAGPTTGPHGETVSPAHLVTLGNLDERALAARLAAQPVFVSAATFEPFGLAVLEAAAAGCPLILSDIATFRELWEGAALFVDAQDAGGFADAIETVVGDAGRRHALSTAAATRALRYRPEAMARDMARLYAETLASAAEKAAA